jgi:hypothetical protein
MAGISSGMRRSSSSANRIPRSVSSKDVEPMTLANCTAECSVRWFVKFCVHARGRAPMTQVHQHSPWEEQLEATQLLMDFAVWLAVSRPSGRPISAKTIGKYLSHVRMWHRQEFFRDIIGDDFGQLKELLKGIARTVAQPPKLERWGVRTQDLAASMLATLPCGGHPLLVRKSSVSYPSVCCVNAWYGARSAA